jgi:hypothetical protein
MMRGVVPMSLQATGGGGGPMSGGWLTGLGFWSYRGWGVLISDGHRWVWGGGRNPTVGGGLADEVGSKGITSENLGWLVATGVGGAAVKVPPVVVVVVGDAWRRQSIGAVSRGRRRQAEV